MRVAVGKSGKWLAAGTKAGRITVWQLDGNTQAIEIQSSKGTLNDLQFSMDERWLAVADRGLTLQPLDRRVAPLVLRDDDGNYGTVRFSSTQDALVTITGNGILGPATPRTPGRPTDGAARLTKAFAGLSMAVCPANASPDCVCGPCLARCE